MMKPAIGDMDRQPSITDDESYVVVKELQYWRELGDGDAGNQPPPPALAVGTVLLAKELRPSARDDSRMRVRFATTESDKGWIDYQTLQDRDYLQLFSRTDSYLRNLVARKRQIDVGSNQHANDKKSEIGTSSRRDREQTKTELKLFLKNLGLDRYFDTLVSEAVHSTSDLKLIEDEHELQALGVESSFHRKKLLKAIKTEL
jgi:hypothetical protein